MSGDVGNSLQGGAFKPGAYFVGQVVKAVSARVEEKVTEPPRRYTEDTLIADMLSAHKFAASEQERAILRETEGLGTSRTREATIGGLIKGGLLISKKKKKLYELTSSELARVMMNHLPDVLTSVATTAKWEVAFKMIERGQTQPDNVKQALRMNLDFIVSTARSTKAAGNTTNSATAQGGRFAGAKSVVRTSGFPQPGQTTTSASKSTGASAAAASGGAKKSGWLN